MVLLLYCHAENYLSKKTAAVVLFTFSNMMHMEDIKEIYTYTLMTKIDKTRHFIVFYRV